MSGKTAALFSAAALVAGTGIAALEYQKSPAMRDFVNQQISHAVSNFTAPADFARAALASLLKPNQISYHL